MTALFAQSQKVQNCPGGTTDPSCLTTLPQVSANSNQLNNALSVIFGIAAAIALLSLVIAAFNFASAGGDSDKISRSKKTIIFSLIGLIICLSAEVIVLTLIEKI